AQAEDAQTSFPGTPAIPLAAPRSETRPRGASAELHQLGGGLAKGDVPSRLGLFFDGGRAAAANSVDEPAGQSSSPRRSGLKPAEASGAKASEPAAPAAEAAPKGLRRFFEFNVQYLRDVKKLFKESYTRPTKQDYVYLGTKTWGLNLAVRAAFALQSVHSGALPLVRAILSTAWYQAQDSVFTVYGQTYMKFLGRMTGMVRIGRAKIGDLFFVYFQMVFFEFLNRLVLGPIGMNPLVYTPAGIALVFLNNLQGMVAGGLLVPVINKLRAAGYVSEKASNFLYQLSSLTMHLGLLATFGFQGLYTTLTTGLMILSWAAYLGLSFFAKDKTAAEKKL
ncbi:MAG: hypothetical protein KGL53_12475, partial [Elusimicrobia bacterium]|nr:hypothetical protein [Elusimicrobiota bacterium]